MNKENKIDEQTAWMLLFILNLIYQNDTVIGKEWSEFEKEVKFRSRFFPKNTLLTQVRDFTEIAKRKIDPAFSD